MSGQYDNIAVAQGSDGNIAVAQVSDVNIDVAQGSDGNIALAQAQPDAGAKLVPVKAFQTMLPYGSGVSEILLGNLNYPQDFTTEVQLEEQVLPLIKDRARALRVSYKPRRKNLHFIAITPRGDRRLPLHTLGPIVAADPNLPVVAPDESLGLLNEVRAYLDALSLPTFPPAYYHPFYDRAEYGLGHLIPVFGPAGLPLGTVDLIFMFPHHPSKFYRQVVELIVANSLNTNLMEIQYVGTTTEGEEMDIGMPPIGAENLVQHRFPGTLDHQRFLQMVMEVRVYFAGQAPELPRI